MTAAGVALRRTVGVRRLPAERDRLAHLADDLRPRWREMIAEGIEEQYALLPEDEQTYVHHMAKEISMANVARDAELFYATAEFTTLLAGAFPTVPLDGCAVSLPGDVMKGLVYLERPLRLENAAAVSVDLNGAQDSGDDVEVRVLLWRMEPLAQWVRPDKVFSASDLTPTLVIYAIAVDNLDMMCSETARVFRDSEGVWHAEGIEQVAALGLAAMLLLQQENLVEHEDVAPSPAALKARGRKAKPHVPVKVVRLRRAVRKGMDEAHAAERSERHVRWIVRGHWRQQACGKARSERRRIYIAPHYKGPEDGTLIVRETVFQW